MSVVLCSLPLFEYILFPDDETSESTGPTVEKLGGENIFDLFSRLILHVFGRSWVGSFRLVRQFSILSLSMFFDQPSWSLQENYVMKKVPMKLVDSVMCHIFCISDSLYMHSMFEINW